MRLRLSRVLGPDGRTLIVALDHGIALGIVKGLEDVAGIVSEVWRGGADAVMVNLGMLRSIEHTIPRGLGVIASIGVVNTALNYEHIVRDAVKLGADCVKVVFFAQVEDESSCIHKVLELSSICSDWNIPLMVEVYPKKEPHNKDVVAHYVRRCCEAGANLIKTFYTGSKESFSYVVRTSQAPIIILGGPKVENYEELLTMVRDALDVGAIGVAFGRNIWQHPEPRKVTEALKMIIHDGKTVSEALKIIRGV